MGLESRGSWSWHWPAYGRAASWTLGQLAEVQGVWPAGEWGWSLGVLELVLACLWVGCILDPGQLAEVQGVWPAGEESQGPWDLRAGGFPLKSEAGSWGL